MKVLININRYYKDICYKKEVFNKIHHALLILNVAKMDYTFVNPLIKDIIIAINNRDNEFLKEFINKPVVWGYSCNSEKCIYLMLK